jgi:hypothetical protein
LIVCVIIFTLIVGIYIGYGYRSISVPYKDKEYKEKIKFLTEQLEAKDYTIKMLRTPYPTYNETYNKKV